MSASTISATLQQAAVDVLALQVSAAPPAPLPFDCIGGADQGIPVLVAGDNDSQAVVLAYYDRLCENMPDGAVMFIGDSHIQGMPVSAAAPPNADTINLGYGGASMRRLLVQMHRPAYLAAMRRAGAIVLFAGHNDGSNSGYYGVPGYQSAAPTVAGMFTARIKPWRTNKWVIACPLKRDQRNGGAQDYNDAMVFVSDVIKSTTGFGGVADVAVVDLNPLLCDASGNLAPQYNAGGSSLDHMNKAANAIACGAFKSALVGLGI